MTKDGLFDVTIGAYDGLEVCELFYQINISCAFSLDKVMVKHDKNGIGLYRDNGLSVFKNENDFELERIKKSLQKTFKDFGLEIVTGSNLRIINYLEVTLNLKGGSFRSCHKPDDIISILLKNLTTLLILLSTCQDLFKNGFQTILPIKNYFKNQLVIMKIH